MPVSVIPYGRDGYLIVASGEHGEAHLKVFPAETVRGNIYGFFVSEALLIADARTSLEILRILKCNTRVDSEVLMVKPNSFVPLSAIEEAVSTIVGEEKVEINIKPRAS